MNEKLRQARLDRSWSQEQAAAQCNVSRTTYIRWEHEGQTPHGYNITEACQAFSMTAYQLGFVKAPSPSGQQLSVRTKEREEVQALSSLPGEDEAAQLVMQRDGVSAETTRLSQLPSMRLSFEQVEVLLSFMGGSMANFDEAKRETLLKLLKAAGLIIIGSPSENPEPWEERLERLAGALKKPFSIDRKTLHGLKYATESYWQLRVRSGIAVPDLLGTVLGHYRTITQLLQGSLLPTTRTSLSAVASETALLAGMLLSTDMQKHDEAQSYYHTALVVAQQSNNDALYAAGLGRMSSLAYAKGKPKEAQTLLQEAQCFVTQSGAFTLRAWLAAEEAEVQAAIAAQENVQNTSTCFKVLEKAEVLADQINSGEETFGMYFDVSRIPAYRGSCNIRLHHPDEAMEALKEALEPLEPSGALTRAVLLDLAEASIQATAVEQACRYINQALEIIMQMQATSSLQRVHGLRQQLKPWSAVQDVRDVDEQLRRFNSGLI